MTRTHTDGFNAIRAGTPLEATEYRVGHRAWHVPGAVNDNQWLHDHVLAALAAERALDGTLGPINTPRAALSNQQHHSKGK